MRKTAMNQSNTAECGLSILRVIAVLFALLSAAPQIVRANDRLKSDFSHDIGLRPEFIATHISRLRVSSGMSHYRMRYYKFDLDEIANQKISSLFAKQRVQSSAFASPPSRMLDTLVAIGRPNTQHTWTWTEAFPPYRQRFIACYPDNDPDFGFRWLEIQPVRAGKRSALLAAGNRVPVLSASALSDCAGIKLRGLAQFYSPISTTSPLPYPFARRSFQEMLRTKFEPHSLNYFGFIFVDAKHWFRFSANKIDFEKIMRSLAMQPKPKRQKIYFDATTHPKWWGIPASTIQWIHCARFPLQTAKLGEAFIEQQRLPLHIYATWESGFGYVQMDSGASSKFATDSCE